MYNSQNKGKQDEEMPMILCLKVYKKKENDYKIGEVFTFLLSKSVTVLNNGC